MPHIDELLGVATIAAAGLVVAVSLQGPVSGAHALDGRSDVPVSSFERTCDDPRSPE